ncbi:histidine phosphatase family protein [Yokenella regensburgei]|jgi:probable phosphoglycerate mutase|uniref:histidine phosphatase family protein n=1 Tax=Yokenella regensburgei TaxID=158877 RepID=UPI000241FEDE|nr:histidine phosphatase family protein [Yokenella regensburgei]EHM45302.1 phosphoglycerate mutase family protein [Yokenella regensburgei ATCC 43003]
MKVILVRHAQTQWNQRGIIQGHSDSALTCRGLSETSALLNALATSGHHIECVYTSPLGRALQMGQSLAECFYCPLLVETALKEQAFGHYEGMSSEHFRNINPDEAYALFVDDAEYCPPGGESLTQASQRVIDFLQHLLATTEHHSIAIVSHGQVIQGVLALLKEGTIDNFSRYAQPNASYSVLEMAGEKCVSLRWGIATHLFQLGC